MLGKCSTPELHTPIQKLFLGRKLSDVNKCPYTTRVTLIPRFLGLAFSHPHPPGIHIVAIRNSTLCDLFAEVLPLNKERYSNYSGDIYIFYIVRMKIEEKRYFIEYYTAHYIAKAFLALLIFTHFYWESHTCKCVLMKSSTHSLFSSPFPHITVPANFMSSSSSFFFSHCSEL